MASRKLMLLARLAGTPRRYAVRQVAGVLSQLPFLGWQLLKRVFP